MACFDGSRCLHALLVLVGGKSFRERSTLDASKSGLVHL